MPGYQTNCIQHVECVTCYVGRNGSLLQTTVLLPHLVLIYSYLAVFWFGNREFFLERLLFPDKKSFQLILAAALRAKMFHALQRGMSQQERDRHLSLFCERFFWPRMESFLVTEIKLTKHRWFLCNHLFYWKSFILILFHLSVQQATTKI